MKTQLGFEIYNRDQLSVFGSRLSDKSLPVISQSVSETDKLKTDKLDSENRKQRTDNQIEIPKLITGHIDILQIRNGMVHILDYKPQAEKERPIEQCLTRGEIFTSPSPITRARPPSYTAGRPAC
jgi:ATP-dependent exoDNAse (exonuclease V) beta subunit